MGQGPYPLIPITLWIIVVPTLYELEKKLSDCVMSGGCGVEGVKTECEGVCILARNLDV